MSKINKGKLMKDAHIQCCSEGNSAQTSGGAKELKKKINVFGLCQVDKESFSVYNDSMFNFGKHQNQ